jgi:hypothetical protein
MKEYEGVAVLIYVFLTSKLVGGEWSAWRPGRFTIGGRATSNLWIGGEVGPRAGLDDVEKRKFLILPGLELRPLGRPTLRWSLYRLHRIVSRLYGDMPFLTEGLSHIVTHVQSGQKQDLTSHSGDYGEYSALDVTCCPVEIYRRCSELSVKFYRPVRRHLREDGILHIIDTVLIL